MLNLGLNSQNQERIWRWVRGSPSVEPWDIRSQAWLRKQRGHLRFLDCDGVDATNNLAEREIRPAVMARRLSAGNRTEARRGDARGAGQPPADQPTTMPVRVSRTEEELQEEMPRRCFRLAASPSRRGPYWTAAEPRALEVCSG